MIDGAERLREPLHRRRPRHHQLRKGSPRPDVVTEFVEQVQVKTSGYNAEFRATTGGVLSAITRSGTNRYSGELGTYYRTTTGAARPSGDPPQSVATRRRREYATTPRDQVATVGADLHARRSDLQGPAVVLRRLRPAAHDVGTDRDLHPQPRRRSADSRTRPRITTSTTTSPAR